MFQLKNNNVAQKSTAAVRQYLDEFFLDIDDEYRALYKFWCQAIKNMPTGGEVLELGVRPTIYTTIPLAEHFDEIHLADYMEDSLLEISTWLNEESSAFNWQPFIKLVLETEGEKPTKKKIKGREQKIREKVTKLLPCNLRSVQVLGDKQKQYDLVTAHYCTDVATNTCEEWLQVIQNIFSLIKPQGWLLISVPADLNFGDWLYGKEPPKAAPKLTPMYVQNCLQGIGMNMESLKLEIIPALSDRPYSNTIVLSIQKPSDNY